VAVLVRDLDFSDTWAGLGFILSPCDVHRAYRGKGNHTIMLGPDHVELVSVLALTDHNAPSRALLKRRRGIDVIESRAWDADAAEE
jgi:hypothetical protein